MKKTVNYAFYYAIAAMIGGVFYREFTKFSDFEGRTTLAFVHTHLFMLGMFMFLIVTVLLSRFALQESKKYKLFLMFYHLGLCVTTIMLVVRGFLQVNMIHLSSGMDAMISGIAGLGHISLGIGIISLFLALKETVKE